MSTDVMNAKRGHATGLGAALTIKPLSDGGEADTQLPAPATIPPVVDAAQAQSLNPSSLGLQDSSEDKSERKGAAQGGGGVLPIITEPELRAYGVSGRVTKRCYDKLNELVKLSNRKQSYLVSRILEDNIDAWVEKMKAHVEENATQKDRRKK